MLAVDSMHCLLEGLSHYHFRYVLQLTSLSAYAKDAPAFSYPFKLPGPNDVHGMHTNELKQVDNIHTLLMSSMSVNSKDVDFGVALALKLSKKNKKPLVFVAESLGVIPACANRSVTKVQLAEALVTWVRLCFLDASLVLIFFLEETIFFFCRRCNIAICYPPLYDANPTSDRRDGYSILAILCSQELWGQCCW